MLVLIAHCGALRIGKLFTSNGDGELVEAHGFVMLGGCKFYADSTDGSPCAGWKNVNGKWYFLMRPLAMHDLAGCTRMAPGSI
ncbi:MAG: hypothetical protein ACLS3M_02405 [Collinsella sp.]